jgi:hypothetical protein
VLPASFITSHLVECLLKREEQLTKGMSFPIQRSYASGDTGPHCFDANFCHPNLTLSADRLTCTQSGAATCASVRLTGGFSSGIHQVSFKIGPNKITATSRILPGVVCGDAINFTTEAGLNTKAGQCLLYYNENGLIYPGGSAFGETSTAGDVITIVMDCEKRMMEVRKNKKSLGSRPVPQSKIYHFVCEFAGQGSNVSIVPPPEAS